MCHLCVTSCFPFSWLRLFWVHNATLESVVKACSQNEEFVEEGDELEIQRREMGFVNFGS